MRGASRRVELRYQTLGRNPRLFKRDGEKI